MSHEFCNCAELLFEQPNGDKFRIPKPKFHDCAYVRARNALIPQAEAVATKLAGKKDSGWGARFTKALSTEMDRLSMPLLRA